MAVVGTAYVIIKAITKNLDKQIEDSVDKGVKKAAPNVEASGEKLGDSVSEGIAKGIDKNPDVDRSFKRMGDRASEGFFTRLRSKVDVRTKAWSAAVHNALGKRGDIDWSALGSRLALRFWTSVNKHNQRESSGWGRKLGGSLAKAVKDIPLPKSLAMAGLAVPLIGGALKIVGSYLAATISLVSALGPAIAAAGLVGASSFLAMGTAFGAVMLALKTKSPMLTRFKEVTASVKSEWQSVGLAVQKTLLPALGGAMTRVTTSMLPLLRKSLADTGTVIGRVANQFAGLTENKAFRARFANVLAGNNVALGNFGSGLVHLANAAVILLSAARPLTEQFSRWTRALAIGVDASAKAGESNGKLAAFMERAGKVAQQIGRIFHNTFAAVADVFKAASPAGQTLLDRIEALTKKWSNWTDSVSGKNKMAAWFAAALPIVHEFNGLIGDVFRLLGKGMTGNSAGTVTFIQDIRTKILPSLVQIAQAFSNSGPGFSNLLSSLATFVQNLANSGTFGNFAKAFQFVLDTMSKILNTPIIGTIAGWSLGFLAMAKAVSWLPGFKFVLQGLGIILQRFVVPALWALSKAFIGLVVSNPWILLVAAIIAGLVLMYKKVDWFRNFVDKVWEYIVIGAQWLWGVLQNVWAWFSGTAIPIMQQVGSVIIGAVVTAFQFLWDIVQNVFTWIRDVAVPVVLKIWGVLVTVGTFIGTVLVNVFKAWWAVVSWVFQAVKVIAEITIAAIVLGFNWIAGVASNAWNVIWTVVSTVFGWIWDKAKTVGGWVAGVFKTIWDWASEWIGKIGTFVAGVWATISGAIGKALDPIRVAWQVIYDKVKGIWDGLSGALSGVWDTVVGGIKTAFNGVKSWINEWIIDKVNGVIETINKVADALHVGDRISKIPQLAAGATVQPQPGGTLARIAEAGRSERIEPLDPSGLSARDRAIVAALSGNGAAAPVVRVFIGDQELRGLVRVEIEQDNKSKERKAIYSKVGVGAS